MIDIEYIARGLSPKAKPYKNGFITCCPAHDDNNPSLIITPGITEDFTVHCLSGCAWDAVKAAIKQTGFYTWQPSNDSSEHLKRGSRKDDFLKAFKAAKAEESPIPAFRTVAEFMPYAAELPPPVQLCGPFYSHSSGFIAAPGGSGKSMFTLGLAKAMAEGKPFVGWDTPKPLKIWIVDVEMADSGLFLRLRALGFHGKLDITLDTSGQRDAAGIGRFRLGPAEDMQLLMQYAHDSEVLIIDNVSACLISPDRADMFSPEAWQQVFLLEQWARQQGKLLIFVDHTNKAGQLAGTLHKHRMADFVLLLERKSMIGEPWLEFTVSMDKCRYDANPDDQIERLVRLQDGRWTHTDPDEQNDHIFQQVIDGGLKAKDAAEEMCIHPNTFTKRFAQYKVRLHRKQRAR